MQENIKCSHHGLRVLRFEQLPALGTETNDPPGNTSSVRWDQSHAFNTVRGTSNHVAIQPARISSGVDRVIAGKRGKKGHESGSH